MNTDQFAGLLRNLLIPIAALAMAHGVTNTMWDQIVGVIASLGLLGWGVYSHDTTTTMLLSAVRSVIGFVAGILVSRGLVTTDQATQWVSGVVVVATMASSYLAHDPGLVQAIASGTPPSQKS